LPWWRYSFSMFSRTIIVIANSDSTTG